MNVIIFGEEPVTECFCFGEGIEVVREVMHVLQRLELRLAVRIVVGYVRAGV